MKPKRSPLRPIYDRLSQRLATLSFAPPVTHVYDPLQYAGRTHGMYLDRYGHETGRVLIFGMNPGPFGMAQTGVPFGEIGYVRDWLGIEGPVDKPPVEHPKRPIEGFACTRSEVSGSRLWGFMKDTFGTADAMFHKAFVANYCPLVFMEESGANRTPDKLQKAEREALYAACDDAMADIIGVLAPSRIVGVGDFAKKRAESIVKARSLSIPVGSILHPSPASPLANRGWPEAVRESLGSQGIVWP